MSLNDAHHRYDTDPQFRQLVEMMTAQITACKFTPSEMRDAAVLASIKYEQMTVRRIVIDPEDNGILADIHMKLKDLEEKYR